MHSYPQPAAIIVIVEVQAPTTHYFLELLHVEILLMLLMEPHPALEGATHHLLVVIDDLSQLSQILLGRVKRTCQLRWRNFS